MTKRLDILSKILMDHTHIPIFYLIGENEIKIGKLHKLMMRHTNTIATKRRWIPAGGILSNFV